MDLEMTLRLAVQDAIKSKQEMPIYNEKKECFAIAKPNGQLRFL